MRKRFSWLTHFNWRMLLMRIVINAISLIVVALLVPNIYFAEKSIAILLAISIGLGIINAIIKPLIQFLTFQFIFASYGIVIVVINAVLLWLLSVFFHQWFVVNGIVWALVGGALLGGLGSFLEALFGLTAPIVPEQDQELRGLIKGETGGVIKTLVDRKELKLESDVASDTEIVIDDKAPIVPDDTKASASSEFAGPESVDDAPITSVSNAGDTDDSSTATIEPESMPNNQVTPEDNTL